ncbi:hypothetical protein ACG74X_01840 [Marivita sp. S0852]|uniref:hypothetical protein n=1 Tax=Marivita sp. S0852 TaxID=3373893 RepID=UPI003982D677
MGLVDPLGQATPKIALHLSDDEGPSWTDVMLNGDVVARIPTKELAHHAAQTTTSL